VTTLWLQQARPRVWTVTGTMLVPPARWPPTVDLVMGYDKSNNVVEAVSGSRG